MIFDDDFKAACNIELEESADSKAVLGVELEEDKVALSG